MGGSISRKRTLIKVRSVESLENVTDDNSVVRVPPAEPKDTDKPKVASPVPSQNTLNGKDDSSEMPIVCRPTLPRTDRFKNGHSSRLETRFVHTSDFPYTSAKLIHPLRRQRQLQKEAERKAAARHNLQSETSGTLGINSKPPDSCQSINSRYRQRLNVYGQDPEFVSRQNGLNNDQYRQSQRAQATNGVLPRQDGNSACGVGREINVHRNTGTRRYTDNFHNAGERNIRNNLDRLDLEAPFFSHTESRILQDLQWIQSPQRDSMFSRGQSPHPTIRRRMYDLNKADRNSAVLLQQVRGMEDIRDFLQRSNRAWIQRYHPNLDRLDEEWP